MSDQPPSERLQRAYDPDFPVDESYRESLPDPQNEDLSSVPGSLVPIAQAGVSNVRVPLKIRARDGRDVSVEASLDATVSLAGGRKGINMSRLLRIFYEFRDQPFTPGLLEEILFRYKREIGSTRARLKLHFGYPIEKPSLRSGLSGIQYYDCAYEGHLDDLDRFRPVIYFDFVYSSACPCATDLSEHAAETRGLFAIPHSQRSKARVVVEVRSGETVFLEDLQAHCEEALQTETQVLVRREDEQAFAEMNAAYVKFVEDAVRLVYEQLDRDHRLRDFEVACAHLESLHSHDAVAVLHKGIRDGFRGDFDHFRDLLC